jgi:hypothetical protein
MLAWFAPYHIGTLALPGMAGAGLRPLTASCVFLFGIRIGGSGNVAGRGLMRMC